MNWMKHICWLLLAMLLCVPCALAENLAGPAAAQVRADLLDAPHDGANVLMRYYVGTRVEVVREVDADYVQVNVGQEGGSLMGYMEKRDLVFGEKEIRKVRAESVYYTADAGTTSKLYSYPDIQAPVNDEAFHIDYKQVLGAKDEKWLHVEDGLGKTGFVDRQEIDLMGPDYTYAVFIYVEPAADEMTREEAADMAKRDILHSDNSSVYAGSADGIIDAAVLDLCTPEVDMLYYYETPDVVMYSIQFRHPQTGYVYAGIDYLMQGREVVKISHGNG